MSNEVPIIDVERIRPLRHHWTLRAHDRTIEGTARTWRRAKTAALLALGTLEYCVHPFLMVNGQIVDKASRRGSTFTVDELPCPACGAFDVVGVLLVTEDGAHQHTRYLCTRWPRGGKWCGWEGWVVDAAETSAPDGNFIQAQGDG